MCQEKGLVKSDPVWAAFRSFRQARTGIHGMENNEQEIAYIVINLFLHVGIRDPVRSAAYD